MQNKGGPFRRTKEELSNPREELAGSRLAHPPPEAGGRGEGKWGRLGPRDGIPYQTANRLQFLTKDFLRFWMVDICQEGC